MPRIWKSYESNFLFCEECGRFVGRGLHICDRWHMGQSRKSHLQDGCPAGGFLGLARYWLRVFARAWREEVEAGQQYP